MGALFNSLELTEEMKLRVDQVLSVWKDPERMEDDAQEFHYPLPWFPQQVRAFPIDRYRQLFYCFVGIDANRNEYSILYQHHEGHGRFVDQLHPRG